MTQFGDPRSHDRAPSHRKRSWPLAADVAARLAAGDTLGAIAREYGRTETTLRQRLNDHGYSTVTALPVPAELPPPGAGTFDAQPWAVDALCQQTGGDAHYPEPRGREGAGTKDAKAVCLSCPVREQCLDYALANDERWGVWGAHTPAERRRMKKAREAS